MLLPNTSKLASWLQMLKKLRLLSRNRKIYKPHTHIIFMGVDLRRKSCVQKLNNTLRILKEKGLSYDKKKLLFEIMAEYNVSERTAKEYLGTAEFLQTHEVVEYEKVKTEAELEADKILGI